MSWLYSPKLVRFAAAFCVAMTQAFFLTKCREANKIYRITRKPRAIRVTRSRRDALKIKYRPEMNDLTHCDTVHESLIQSKSNLPEVDSLVRYVYLFTVGVNSYLALKYFVLCLLHTEMLAEYRYLDCILIGRASINGRIVNMVRYATMCNASFQLGWRITMLFIKPDFNFSYMEFIMMDPNKLASWRIEWQRTKPTLDYGRRLVALEYYSTLLDYKNPFIGSNSPDDDNWLRPRPNRSSAAWAHIARNLLRYLIGMGLFFFLGFLALSPMFAPMVITTSGFRLNYDLCVKWINKQPNKLDYEFIFSGISNISDQQPLPRQVFMPFENFIEINPYQVIRMILDLFENTVIFVEAAFSYVIYSSIAVVMASDLCYYCRVINKRMQTLINRLSATDTSTLDCHFHDDSFSSAPLKIAPSHSHNLVRKDDYRAQIIDIQAMIVDFLALISNYNSYAAFDMLYILSIWFAYSAICASWLFIPDEHSEPGRAEWYVIQALSTMFIFITVGCYNAVRRESIRLYLLITMLSGLDRSNTDGEHRWLGLMRHYSPKPLYCFRILRSTCISWLVALRSSTWLASALFVASGFFSHPSMKQT